MSQLATSHVFHTAVPLVRVVASYLIAHIAVLWCLVADDDNTRDNWCM